MIPNSVTGDRPGVVLARATLASLQKSAKAAQRIGETDLWIRIVRCIDFHKYVYDIKTCKLLSHVIYHVVLSWGLTLEGVVSKTLPGEMMSDSIQGYEPVIAGSHSGPGSYGTAHRQTCTEPK